jgi:hypothetical protein
MNRLLLAMLPAMILMAGGAVAQSNYLSAYGGGSSNYLSAYGGGGGSDYRDALMAYGRGGGYLGSGGGFFNTNAGKAGHFRGGGVQQPVASVAWGNTWHGRRPLPTPCGNFLRAAARCRLTTLAWDPTFQTQRAW